MAYPNSGSTVSQNRASTVTGLSSQIIIKVQDFTVGAIQELRINQNKPLKRYNEIGTDGVIEIVPASPAAVNITVSRVVFDGMSLPESFARAFMNIQAQRLPFNIDIFDMQGKIDTLSLGPGIGTGLAQGMSIDRGVRVDIPPLVKRLHNCWFTSLSTPIMANNFIITESAEIWSEYITTFIPAQDKSLRPAWPGQRANIDTIEKETDTSGRRGSYNENSFEQKSLKDAWGEVKKSVGR